MAQPSDLESWTVFALPNGVDFSADCALQTAKRFPFQRLSIVAAGLYQ
ncbi:hypothetical protein [Pusillimonas caeni]|nr:hypothetical protein [Pusillimonas caeni]